jgi:hypothetical protein
LPRTVTFPAAVVVTLWCVFCALMADAWATPLERVEFESASQRLNSIEVIPGDRIQGYLAKPEGAGPFPAGAEVRLSVNSDPTTGAASRRRLN